MTTLTPSLPSGYSLIPAGTFTPGGASAQVQVANFGMAKTPVTNAQYGELASSLGQDRFVLLDHDFETGATQLVRRGATFEIAAAGPVYAPEDIDFDQGDIIIFGSQIFVKLVDNPSEKYDKGKRLFSGAAQPAIGLTYFHANAWCLLKSLEDGGKYRYGLPTDVQYEYVASDKGTKEYGTETGALFKDGKRLAHIEEYHSDKETTVAVNDSRYVQALPFDVQTTGNVWRWIQMNPTFKQVGDFFSGPYGLRGGSWGSDAGYGRAACRDFFLPNDRGSGIGFSPVVVLQDSK